MLAFTLENLLFLLLIAVAGLFQLLSKTINKAGKSDSNETSGTPRPQIPRPIQRLPRESDADRIRKFLEALGQPPSSRPPPPVLPRTDIPPRPVAPVQPPPVLKPTWRLPQERRQKPNVAREESHPSEPPRRFHEITPPPGPVPVPLAFQVHEMLPEAQQPQGITPPGELYGALSQTSGRRADSRMDIATLLASVSSLRQAILFREILGTPRGLKPLDAG
jgi:hypothetical protein